MATKSKKRRGDNLTWREVAGQNLGRWNPGPALRRHGFRAIDLWAGPGTVLTQADWAALGFGAGGPSAIRNKAAAGNIAMPLNAARAAAKALNALAREQMRGQRGDDPTSPKKPAVKETLTVNRLLDAFLADRWSTLSPRTRQNYSTSLTAVRQWIGDDHVGVIGKEELLEAYAVWSKQRGPHGAYKSIATLQTALEWAHGRPPWTGHVMPTREAYTNLKLPKPPGRLRVALPAETDALLLAMDAPDVIYDQLGTPLHERELQPAPGLGDALIILLWTCARVSDALLLQWDNIYHDLHTDHDMIVYRPTKVQHKKRTTIAVPILGPLKTRLEQMRARRATSRTTSEYLITDERLGLPYINVATSSGIHQHTRFTTDWRARRALAATICPSLEGHGTNRLGDPWLAFNAQDCRDTAATRILRATGDIASVALYHGSSPANMVRLAQHYLEIDPMGAADVGERLEAYAKRAGINV